MNKKYRLEDFLIFSQRELEKHPLLPIEFCLMSILNEILKNKREALQAVKTSVPLAELKARIKDAAATRSFRDCDKKGAGQSGETYRRA